MNILVDNDIVAKVVTYNLEDVFAPSIGLSNPGIGVLGTLKYVITPKRLKHAADGPEAAYERLQNLLSHIPEVEPSPSETELAAEIEELAIINNLPIDGGESQLCAIAISRGSMDLCTGDKRAIVALDKLQAYLDSLHLLHRRILCLEALFLKLIAFCGYNKVRSSVCSAAGVDMALRMCFSCDSGLANCAQTESGLRSYINTLNRASPNYLIPT